MKQGVQRLDGVVNEQTRQLHDLRQENSHLECMANEAAEEVTKGNQIIRDLASDLKVSRDKLKRRQEIVLRQVSIMKVACTWN